MGLLFRFKGPDRWWKKKAKKLFPDVKQPENKKEAYNLVHTNISSYTEQMKFYRNLVEMFKSKLKNKSDIPRSIKNELREAIKSHNQDIQKWGKEVKKYREFKAKLDSK